MRGHAKTLLRVVSSASSYGYASGTAPGTAVRARGWLGADILRSSSGQEREGCERNSDTRIWAASNDHLEVLKWSICSGCDDDEEDFEDISDFTFHKWFREYQAKSSN